MPRVCIFSSVHIALDNRVFYREARSLRKAGYEVTLIAIHPTTELKDGIHIIGLPVMPRWKRPALWVQILRLARFYKADLYHFHDPELLLVTPWLRLLTRKPIIYDVHEAYADFFKVKDYLPAWIRYPVAWIFRWMEPFLARFQSGLIFSDDEIAKSFNHLQRPKTTLYNFPSRIFINDASIHAKEVQDHPPTILHLGGHERNRGAFLMIAAFKEVVNEIPNAKLLLVGHFMPPNLQEEVQADISRCGLQDNVIITGRVPFESICDFLRISSVGWIPWLPYRKNQKNIPTKLFEYMSFGLPVVSSNLCSTQPFFENSDIGYLVTPDDPFAHAEALKKILHKPEEAREMGIKGQLLVQSRYNWDAMEESLYGLYEKLLHT